MNISEYIERNHGKPDQFSADSLTKNRLNINLSAVEYELLQRIMRRNMDCIDLCQRLSAEGTVFEDDIFITTQKEDGSFKAVYRSLAGSGATLQEAQEDLCGLALQRTIEIFRLGLRIR